ncbi:hypothetical protein C7212DRAFT_361947 [Tuber magnatum]|uniref:G domain-containing protein n=1 Tax=Tuber magnatum TaxID=42249 RepID=A0A317SYD1_9PEZI|nr:hypothetical protein C7212DRAFT_361947 [Tuber magnatum]
MASPGNPQISENKQIPSLREVPGGPNHGKKAGHLANKPAVPSVTNTGRRPRPLPGPEQQVSAIPPEASPDTEIIIALMGVTGAGKSYFIREVSGNSQVKEEGTREIQSYSFEYGGARITLVDTPGFNDTNRSDTEVLREIADWASESYRNGRLLSGIIYLHPITHTRMEGSALKNLKVFQKLCGQEFLGNVFLTTTQWSNVDPAEGGIRENSLRGWDFWGGLIDEGATLQRFRGTRESGMELIRRLMQKDQKPLDIQDQIVNKHMTLLETAAGKFINEELIAQEERHKEEIEFLERERQEAINERDNEIREILAAEQARFQKNLERVSAEKKSLVELHAAEVKRRKGGKMREGMGRPQLVTS